jgi:ribosome biogenesis GTPase
MSKIGRGRHTTRTVTLIPLPGGGLLADTPGFNMPTLDRVAAVDLAGMFPEFRSQVEQQPCRFDNCQHVMEPGCSINTQPFDRWAPVAVTCRSRVRRGAARLQAGGPSSAVSPHRLAGR